MWWLLLLPQTIGARTIIKASQASGHYSRFSALSSAPLRRIAARRQGAIAAALTEPRALTGDGDFCMWSPEPDVHKLSVRTKEFECTFETGRIARLAGGAVLLSVGENVVFASACFQPGGSPTDFLPLKVDYQERFSAGGITPGGYIKRDGRPGDAETLASRLIDRPIRPAFPKGWSQETQIVSYVLSYDALTPPDCMAVCASAAALSISDVPFEKPVACVRVTRSEDGSWRLNAPMAEQSRSDVSLVLAGTEGAILMVEGFCRFVPEEDVIAACAFAHEAVRDICRAVGAWQAAVGKPKALELVRVTPAAVASEVERACGSELEAVLQLRSKKQRELGFDALKRRVELELCSAAPGAAAASAPAPAPVAKQLELGDDAPDKSATPDAADADADEAPPHSQLKAPSMAAPSMAAVPRAGFELADVQLAFQKLATATLRRTVAEGGVRPDGRSSTQVRPLRMETGVLPRTHGSALFTRGETQSLATVTLGDASSEQKYEGLSSGQGSKRFYLQYSFPPFSVGEVGRFGGAPGRREVGHGNLAERALLPAMPVAGSFPYTVRLESLITMSCGSSSMASVCGGCLAMMDAAVPLTRPVAGVAMGLLFDESGQGRHVVLTDILGLEDALGSMDFKVAGDADGVTALQLDVKCEGLDVPLLRTALAQALAGRRHILAEMTAVLPGPRASLPANVPRIVRMKLDPAHCGAIIGKEGKTISAIIEQSGVDNIDLSRSEGVVSITGKTDEAVAAARARIEAIVAECEGREKGPRPEVAIGDKYTGEVKSVMPFGIFVELLPGLDGFCHISELSDAFLRKVEDAGLSPGDSIEVVVSSRNDKGQYRVRRVMPGAPEGVEPAPAGGEGAEGAAAQRPPIRRSGGGGGGGGGGGRSGGGGGGGMGVRRPPAAAGSPVAAGSGVAVGAKPATAEAVEEAALSAAFTGLAEPVE